MVIGEGEKCAFILVLSGVFVVVVPFFSMGLNCGVFFLGGGLIIKLFSESLERFSNICLQTSLFKN